MQESQLCLSITVYAFLQCMGGYPIRRLVMDQYNQVILTDYALGLRDLTDFALFWIAALTRRTLTAIPVTNWITIIQEVM